MAEDFIAFGSTIKVDQYKRDAGIKVTRTKEEVKPKPHTPTSAFKIGNVPKNEKATVTEEELELLENVILRDDPEVVFMQSNLEFYDSYYLTQVKIDDELMEEVRKIRRIYKNYPKYLYACFIRDKYLDILEEKYEEESLLRFVDNKVLYLPRGVFIPPAPIYSRNAEDYDRVMAGNYYPDEPFEEPTEEEIKELLASLLSDLDLNPEEVEVESHDVLTHHAAIEAYEEATEKEDSDTSRFSGPSVNVKDLDNLQRIIKSWYKKDEKEDEKEDKFKIPFPNSEEGIRERYRTECAAYLVNAIANGATSEESENDMVYDDVTSKTMTRKELNQRKLVRSLKMDGWDEVKIMSQLGIGSRVERTIQKNKMKRKKKARKKAMSFMGSIMGDDSGFDEPASSIDELRKYLFDS